jgi:hypothetical protein
MRCVTAGVQRLSGDDAPVVELANLVDELTVADFDQPARKCSTFDVRVGPM